MRVGRLQAIENGENHEGTQIGTKEMGISLLAGLRPQNRWAESLREAPAFGGGVTTSRARRDTREDSRTTF